VGPAIVMQISLVIFLNVRQLMCLLLGHAQSDLEKLEGLPVAPYMDRDKVTKPSSQIGFIKFILLPLLESVVELFPNLAVSLTMWLQLSGVLHSVLKFQH